MTTQLRRGRPIKDKPPKTTGVGKGNSPNTIATLKRQSLPKKQNTDYRGALKEQLSIRFPDGTIEKFKELWGDEYLEEIRRSLFEVLKNNGINTDELK